MRSFISKPITLPLWALVLAALVAMGIGGAGSSADKEEEVAATDTTTAAASEEPTSVRNEGALDTTTAPTTAPKQWQKVTEASGTAGKRTGTFQLSGGDARLRYTSKGDVFAVYVVKAGESLQEKGGFPEFMCSEPCSDETMLANSSGGYYLDITASGGSWAVVVEELR